MRKKTVYILLVISLIVALISLFWPLSAFAYCLFLAGLSYELNSKNLKVLTVLFVGLAFLFFLLGTYKIVFDSNFYSAGTQLANNEKQRRQETAISSKGRDSVDIENNNIENKKSYRIVEKKDMSHRAMGDKTISDLSLEEIKELPWDKKMEYRIVVGEEISSEQVRPIVERIIDKITEKHPDEDEIILNLVSHKSIGSAYDIARAIWAPKGDLGNITPCIARSNDRSNYQISIEMHDDLEQYLEQQTKMERKHGLSEKKRREIYRLWYAAEGRAIEVADERYPVGSKENSELNDHLYDKYCNEIKDKYNITEKQLTRITSEARREGWSTE